MASSGREELLAWMLGLFPKLDTGVVQQVWRAHDYAVEKALVVLSEMTAVAM